MFQLVSIFTVLIALVNGDSPAERDGYTSVTKRPTSYLARMARSDRYTSRPTSYAKAMKSDGYFGLFRRYTKRPTLYKAAKSDRYTSRPTPPYAAAAKSDGFLRYFRRYFTKRPTSRYARSDLRTLRPTTRRYGVRGDLRTQRPTSRRYGVEARSDLITRKPTRQRYTDKFAKVEVDEDEKVGQVGKGATSAQMVPEAEVMDKKYFYVKNRLGWNNAQEACARRGAQLATIHSKNEHERVGKACQGECWLGADRSDVAGSFKWNDDSAMDFENWGDQARQKSGLCAKMSESATKEWMTADCDEKLGFVCQKMQWNGRLQASVESDSLSFAATFARGNILSLAMMIVVVIVVGFLGCNYACMFVKDQKSGMFGKQGEDRTKNGTRDETTPLLWTRA